MERSNQIDEANQRKHEHAAGGPIAKQSQRACRDTLLWLISVSLGRIGCKRNIAVQQPTEKERRCRGVTMGVGVGIGIAIGAAVGAAMRNEAMEVALGTAFGVAVGAL